jgi:hypothetical protein
MCHGRNDGDEIMLTHEFMAMMIAADRSGVTVSLHVLEGAGMIRSRRGRVLILDRSKLEELAGEGDGRPKAEYRKLIAPFARMRREWQAPEPVRCERIAGRYRRLLRGMSCRGWPKVQACQRRSRGISLMRAAVSG